MLVNMLEKQNTHFENGEDIVISGTDELLGNENAIGHAVDGVPIEVYLKRDRAEVWQIQELIVTILLGMIVVEFIGSFIIYVNRTWKEK